MSERKQGSVCRGQVERHDKVHTVAGAPTETKGKNGMREYVSFCTKKELLEMENYYPDEKFNGVVIVPMNKTHMSGWRAMKYVLVNGEKIVGVLGGGSDVLHINGIGGYGLDFDNSIKTGTVKRVAYKIDCLRKSGCVRLFADHWLTLGNGYYGTSDFMIYAGERIK